MMFGRCFVAALWCVIVIGLMPQRAVAWGKGHRLIRLWAVARLPEWQREWVGEPHLERLCRDYTSLQDKHAGGNAPELDRYCVVPGGRLSLHDVNAAEPSFRATRWYLEQIIAHLQQDQTDEAMKFLGVLCHWNEDPGCPSAHCSPVTELQLKTLLPPPPGKENLNFLYGYGGIADAGAYEIADEPYQPRLLGASREEVVARIWQHQRLLERRAAARIVPLVQDMLYGDGRKADEQRAAAALENGRHVADVIYTVFCLAAERIDPGEAARWQTQPLTQWEPEFSGGRVGHPYYVTPFLVNQALDANRNLHPLRFGAAENAEPAVANGYGMGAPFTLSFTLAPGGVFERFTCRVGLHETAGADAEVAFAVLANGRECYRTEPLRAGSAAVEIDVDLPQEGILTLGLQTIPTDAAASKQNLAVWGEPVLWRSLQ